jgi:hypothetical protein
LVTTEELSDPHSPLPLGRKIHRYTAQSGGEISRALAVWAALSPLDGDSWGMTSAAPGLSPPGCLLIFLSSTLLASWLHLLPFLWIPSLNFLNKISDKFIVSFILLKL